MIVWKILFSMIVSKFNPKNYLQDIIDNSYSPNIKDKELLKLLNNLNPKIEKLKGIYTVLITLSLYKIENPKQDIRYHKIELKNGFSGRSYDTKNVTPVLKKNSLPSMAESGWLTRSLEQAYPYDLNYKGKIQDEIARKSFLNIIDKIQKSPNICRDVIIHLINEGKKIKSQNFIEIKKIKKIDKFTIQEIISLLKKLFFHKYGVAGASKLPVIFFHVILKQFVQELEKYKNKSVKDLGSHTTSDRTSKSSGDIEIFDKKKLLDSYEIKMGHVINTHLILRAYEKIKKFNPRRYFLLSTEFDEKNFDLTEIDKIRKEHGCEIIVGNYFEYIEKYLTIIDNLNNLIDNFTNRILSDKELKIIHKKKWDELIQTL